MLNLTERVRALARWPALLSAECAGCPDAGWATAARERLELVSELMARRDVRLLGHTALCRHVRGHDDSCDCGHVALTRELVLP